MGQRANSGRRATLDNQKGRAAGRQQNTPSRKAITDRQEAPPVPGASGKEGKANRRGGVASFVAGNTSGAKGGRVTRRLAKTRAGHASADDTAASIAGHCESVARPLAPVT
jgi:hypothetical protein